MTQVPASLAPHLTGDALAPRGGGFSLLLRLKLRLLRNRVLQLADQSPLRLMLVVLFMAVIWGSLYAVFDYVFTFMRRFEQQAVIAIPLVFHIFVLAMTVLLSFSAAVLVYSALYSRAEPSFLLAAPTHPRHVVTIMYLEALFFASWSLLLLGLPLMMAIGNVLGLPWHFYLIFSLSLIGFVPIPGAIGLVAATVVAIWLPRVAARTLIYAAGLMLLALVLWWGRLWTLSAANSGEWLQDFLGEMEYLRGALLPSTWVTNAIRFSIDSRLDDAMFYLGVISSTGLFFSWAAVTLVGRLLPPAFAGAQSGGERSRRIQGRASLWMTHLLFFYLPSRSRMLVLKDVRNFLRDPAQWSQLAILFGLLSLYLLYLPRSRPEGFNLQWQALICFLNQGAVTLILSTFTSRFVFPMVSMEGRQMWLVGLWPMQRASVMWAKLTYALTICGFAAVTVTILSIRALQLPPTLAAVQAGATFAVCVGLCGMAIGLGARLPSYNESSAGRVASGLGGTVNLIASVALVTLCLALVGWICLRMVGQGDLNRLDGVGMALFGGVLFIGLGAGSTAMRIGIRAFQRAEF